MDGDVEGSDVSSGVGGLGDVARVGFMLLVMCVASLQVTRQFIIYRLHPLPLPQPVLCLRLAWLVYSGRVQASLFNSGLALCLAVTGFKLNTVGCSSTDGVRGFRVKTLHLRSSHFFM
jgi:hypothetical protein